ncbi:hypothetical protein [Candidatus Villigracilis affinis]|uniref:hypothetical protein n=1 Tax=Candidatus Villigracilis affinis TaxID=3140682 RepID=UPI001DDE5D80|nr:hypothetical protein [Anaerolineales bacterium]
MPESIMDYWKFDEADLGANRLGQLTEKQKKYLVGEHKSQRGVFIGVGVVVAFLFLCLPALLIGSRVLLPMLLSGKPSDLQELIPLIAMGGFGIIFIGTAVLIVGAVVIFYVIRARKPAELAVLTTNGKVEYTWGTKRVRTPGSSVRSYEDVRVLHLNLGDKKFEVKEQLQEIIQEGEEWSVYYTSYPFKFLSAEKR